MQAGIVVYQRQGNQLVGRWSHQNNNGVLADEIVHDVAPGAVEGDWPVEIFEPNGKLQFTGRLNSSKWGDCVKLSWTGSLSNGTSASFEGIGTASGADILSATFELITA